MSVALIVGAWLIGIRFNVNVHVPMNVTSAVASFSSASYPLNSHTPSATSTFVLSGFLAVILSLCAYVFLSLGNKSNTSFGNVLSCVPLINSYVTLYPK